VQLREIMNVDFKNQTKYLNTFCGQKADYNIKVGDYILITNFMH